MITHALYHVRNWSISLTVMIFVLTWIYMKDAVISI